MADISGLDHVIIAVGDLDAGEAAMRRLGFRTTPRGYHSAHMGTANSTIVFADRTYFEVLGPVAETEANRPIREGLAAGRALFGVAMKTEDAAAAQAGFAARGISDGPVNDFSRPVALPEGAREAAFRTTNISAEASPGAYAFVCQHLTPELVWRPDYLEQENGVVGLKEVVACSSDLAAAEAGWARILPGAVRRATEDVIVDFGNGQLHYLAPPTYRARFGAPPAVDPGLGALVFASADMARTRALLSGAGAVFKEEGGQLLLPATEACGVTFAFRAA